MAAPARRSRYALDFVSRYSTGQLEPHALLVRMLVPLFAMEAVNTILAQLCMAYRFFSLPNLAALVQRLLQAAFE